MVIHTKIDSLKAGIGHRALPYVALVFLLVFSVATFADSYDQEQLRQQMKEAQQQLDEAAQRVAELSREMSGGEVARVVKRISVGRRKAMLGVRIDHADSGEGVRIISVTPQGPAEKAGVQSNDLLRSINGNDLTSGSSNDAIEQMLMTLKELEPGDIATLAIMRDGRSMTFDVTTESLAKALPRFGSYTDSEGEQHHVSEILENLAIELPEIHADLEIDGDTTRLDLDASDFEDLKQLPKRLEEAMGKLSSSGPIIAMLGGSTGLGHQFRFAPITPSLGDYFGVDRGVLLTAIPEDNDSLGLMEGDVLMKVDGKEVNSRHDVYSAFAHAEEGEMLSVEVVRQREGVTLSVAAPKNPWGHAWKCLSDDIDDDKQERCLSKDGRSFSFRFSTEDE